MFVRVVAGFAQAALGIAVAVVWRRWHPVSGPGDLAEQFIHGASQWLYFVVLTPWGWLALWLFVEGLVRVLAAAMNEPLGTLPVAIGRAARRLRVPSQLPADLVARHDDGVIIDSARDYDWHALTTVDVAGELYSVTREAGSRQRPHRYRLTPVTPQHVVRTVTRYTTSHRAK